MEGNREIGRGEPDSLAPIQLEPIGVDEEVAQMKGGRGSQLTLILFAGVLAVAGTMRWLDQVDDSRAYAEAADRLDALETQHAAAYLRCALPDMQRSQLADRQALHNAIELVSDRFDKYYGRQLQKCAYLLDEQQRELGALSAPSDMQRGLDVLRVASQNFADAWETYRDYLQDPQQRYDYVQATPLIEKITLAWDTFQREQTRMKEALRAHH